MSLYQERERKYPLNPHGELMWLKIYGEYSIMSYDVVNCNKIVTNWFIAKLYLELNNNDSESEKEDSTARKRSEEPAGKFDKKKKKKKDNA